ncbi:MAG TPA: flavin-nucleotide-binding protein [Gammaproteobacteria bacterium]|nr:flavin-nucleotide-binding protein [Gammaproteobacteria bacterium]
MTTLNPTTRTKLSRLPERGRFDIETIHSILDAMPMCHVAYMWDGKPAIVPTLQWREQDQVFWHGSTGAASHLKGQENDVCLNVCIFDGLVLARSAFHHSANYRSVTIFGTPERVIDHDKKTQLMKNFVEGFFPGRWDQLRPLKDKEIRATSILSLPITEASAKIRSGPPSDEDEDYAYDVWAGVLPITMRFEEPHADEFTTADVERPSYLVDRSIGQ